MYDPARWMAVTFSSDGRIASVSSSAESLIGYTPSELMGEPVTQILADRSVFAIPQMMDAANVRGGWDGEIVFRGRNGQALESRGTVSLLIGEQTVPSYSMMTFLRETNEVWPPEGDEALYEIGTRLRSFAHEMNNPLAVSMGFAQLILMDAGCQGKTRDDVGKLFGEIQRIIQVVERLHGFATSLQSEPEKTTVGRP